MDLGSACQLRLPAPHFRIAKSSDCQNIHKVLNYSHLLKQTQIAEIFLTPYLHILIVYSCNWEKPPRNIFKIFPLLTAPHRQLPGPHLHIANSSNCEKNLPDWSKYSPSKKLKLLSTNVIVKLSLLVLHQN